MTFLRLTVNNKHKNTPESIETLFDIKADNFILHEDGNDIYFIDV